MNKVLKFIAIMATVMTFAACGGEDDGNNPPTNSREIVYTLSSKVVRATLTTDAEWDALLDQFCSYTQEGQTISFYNSQRQVATGKSAPRTKEAVSISTTSREEMKNWMKEMEKAGKTVTVTYDEGTGTWNGTAYANGAQMQAERPLYTGTLTLMEMPDVMGGRLWALQLGEDSLLFLMHENQFLSEYTELQIGGSVRAAGDEVTLTGIVEERHMYDGNRLLVLNLTPVDKTSIVGKWHYYNMYTMSITQMGDGFAVSDQTTMPEQVGNVVYYEFREDGTMTYTRGSVGSGSTQTSEGTWSLSTDGELCCEYFDGDNCWEIGFVANGMMVLDRHSYDPSGNGVVFYQMQLHAVNH